MTAILRWMIGYPVFVLIYAALLFGLVVLVVFVGIKDSFLIFKR